MNWRLHSITSSARASSVGSTSLANESFVERDVMKYLSVTKWKSLLLQSQFLDHPLLFGGAPIKNSDH